MRFFKSDRTLPTPYDSAAAVRLTAVVDRGKAQNPLAPAPEEVPPRLDRVERRFWTPDELAQENGCG